MKMFRSHLVAAALLSVAVPVAASADACKDALQALNATYQSGTVADITAAAAALRGGGACNDQTVTRALSQASGVLAGRAGSLVAGGDLDAADAILAQAPGLHWAVQAVRADIAAERGDRAEAAQLYNAALDTITDPALTKPNAALIPHAERLAKLANENMMLAGTMVASVTRGGKPSGVLRSAKRGISIEAVGAEAEVTETGGAVGEKREDLVDGGEVKDAGPVPGKVGEQVEVVVHEDPYAGGKKEDFAVADGAAKATKAVFLPIRFGTDSDQLDPKGAHEAEYVGAFLTANHIQHITLIGHTDDTGPDGYNLDLSLRRAQSVRQFLTHYGVTAYIAIDGKGESHPPDLHDPYIYSLDERRAIARRVELVLHK